MSIVLTHVIPTTNFSSFSSFDISSIKTYSVRLRSMKICNSIISYFHTGYYTNLNATIVERPTLEYNSG